MSIRVGKTGNEAVAEAMRQINPDVVAAYPITPQTEIVQIFSSFVANGKVDTEFVTVESEHSALRSLRYCFLPYDSVPAGLVVVLAPLGVALDR
jgi:TPP-dependent indolepyruvate ferredoxin oxidoreductase alpha subunit